MVVTVDVVETEMVVEEETEMDVTDVQAVVTVAIRADDRFRVGLFRATCSVPGQHLLGRHVVRVMTLPARLVDFPGRVHDIGWRDVVFIIAVGVRIAVAVRAADVVPTVPPDQWFLAIVFVADVARAIVCLGQG